MLLKIMHYIDMILSMIHSYLIISENTECSSAVRVILGIKWKQDVKVGIIEREN